MILKQFFLKELAHASYLVMDERVKVAAVVDPQRDVDVYLAEADRLGVSIKHVFLTHFHADFLAGHLELRAESGARIHLGERASAEFDFVPMKHGEAVEFGDVRLSFLATPGHTPESTSLVVHDLLESESAPHAVLTGDTLFIGDVGRPDLMASIGVTANELAEMLYDSVHQKLMRLPDATLVYPAHGAGSMCGKNLSTDTVSTIGAQRASNYALQARSRQEFVRLVTSDQPEAPAYFPYDARLNGKLRGLLSGVFERALMPLALEEVQALRRNGAQLLDARSADAYAAEHVKGSLNVGLGGSFSTWCGALLDPERPIVLLADPGTERDAVLRLARIGFDRVAGFVSDGVAAYAARPELVERGGRVTPDELKGLLAAKDAPLVLDVRTPAEWAGGHIEGALHVPLNRLQRELERVPRGRDLVVLCAGGYRSSAAASILHGAGYGGARDLVGGWNAWTKSAASCSLG